MEVKLDSETLSRLGRVAAVRGIDPETLAKEAIERFVIHDEWLTREVQRGMASVGHGEIRTDEEVNERMQRLIAQMQSCQ